MFLSKLGERSGLFGILAPRRKKKESKANNSCDDDDAESNDDDEINDANKDEERSKEEDTQLNNDTLKVSVSSEGEVELETQEEKTEEQNQEAHLKKRRIEYQQKMEAEAESRGAFCKKQRVKYHNRIHDKWEDAVVVGVHFDDGPDKPYYTISFRKLDDSNEGGNGDAEPKFVEVEKQTTPDRLQRVPFDEVKSWELLK